MNATLGSPGLTGTRRAILAFGLASAVLACWAYLALMMQDMSKMAAMPGAMAMPAATPASIAGLFVMWLVMQAAMMLPSAAPMIHTFARLRAGGDGDGRGALLAPVALFGAGYLLAWSAFSLGAATLQALLTDSAVLSAMGMRLVSAPLAGAVLIAAGLYQWMPWKQACLRRCRTPLGFLMTEWREGRWGPAVMGWRHGLFCVGCCWALMCLLFVAGVMNPIWIVAIALYVLVEKVVPHGEAITRLAGAELVLWGGVVALS